MTNATYQIPAENLESLTAKLDALIKKAVKLGFEPPAYAVGATYERRVVRPSTDFVFDGEEDLSFLDANDFITYHEVTVSGSSPRIDGWSFAATADHAEEPVIIRSLSSVKIPARYRECGSICEHCRLNRARSTCYLLSHEDGRILQVGKSCLKDFLGHKSPERMAEMAELLRDAEDACSDGERGGKAIHPALVQVLTWASSVIGSLGWTPKSKENLDVPNGPVSTATTVSLRMSIYEKCRKNREGFPFALPTKLDFDRAQAAIEFAKSMTGASDYELNVRAIAERSSVSSKNLGLAVSIMGSFDRANTKRVEVKSEFVGTVGRKVNCACDKKTCKCAPIVVFVSRVVELESEFGTSYINIMRDARGNTLVWKTGTCLLTGAEYLLTGAVKEHSEKYGKQTTLTRCKVERVEVQIEESEQAA